jgi:hypothetical protein
MASGRRNDMRKKTTRLKRPPVVAVQRLVLRLHEQLWTMVRRATYVCAHNYAPSAPVRTREVAIEDLRAETRRTIDLLLETENKRIGCKKFCA